MKKQQFVLIAAAILVFIVIIAFGNFIPPKNNSALAMPMGKSANTSVLNTTDVVKAAQSKLNTTQQNRVNLLLNEIQNNNASEKKLKQYHQLSDFWNDSANNSQLGTYYLGEAAKLENSEQNITFAARKLLSYVMAEQSQPMQTWMATQAKELFEQALKINPADDSAQVGLGGCYMFGNISNNPMQEILKVREIAEKKPDNLYAQMMLGLGGIQSGQFENAVKRFQIVVSKQPNNLEAIFDLAETYDRMQDKANAITWYKKAQQLVQIPEAKNEIAKRISELENE